MDQHFLNAAFGIVAAVGGWFCREMWTAVKDLKTDLSKLREDMPRSYVSKDDFRRDIDELKDICKQIFSKLDNKADK